ncbi:threonine/serine exporter family protein [bacterium]|nr:threonine/serine exporter family protein [bacterium]
MSAVDPRIGFLIALGRSLHENGIPAHRLEETLGLAATRLGLRAEFLSTPTSLISAFGEPGSQQTALARVTPGELRLDRIVALDDTVEALWRGDIDVEQASRRLREIADLPPPYGPALTAAAMGAASAAAARVFGAGLPEVAVSAVLGVAVGALGIAARRSVTVGRVHEFVAAMAATLLAVTAAAVWPQLAVAPVIVSSVIVLLPGLALTLALNELATGHLVSGTARLTGSFMTLLKLGLGVGLGQQLATLVAALPARGGAQPAPLPEWTLAAALLVTAPALAVLFRARRGELAWMLAGIVIAFGGARLGVHLLGPALGALLGALLAGLAGNLYERRRRRPAVVMIVPSLIMLVPGALGYRSLSFLMERDVVAGIDSAVIALLVGVSLVAGMLLANVLLPPRHAL